MVCSITLIQSHDARDWMITIANAITRRNSWFQFRMEFFFHFLIEHADPCVSVFFLFQISNANYVKRWNKLKQHKNKKTAWNEEDVKVLCLFVYILRWHAFHKWWFLMTLFEKCSLFSVFSSFFRLFCCIACV